LEIMIHQDRARQVLGLSQKAYIQNILMESNMHVCNRTPTPVVKGDKLHSNQGPREQYEVDRMKMVLYTLVIRSLYAPI
jgi:hypothetical protein